MSQMAERVGFEPTAQGLPVHGISNAAPSAARSPLQVPVRRGGWGRPPRPRGGGGGERGGGPPPLPSAWRRGEDLNPRGTFWAPIRFRVGRLKPGSATPPHQPWLRFVSKNCAVSPPRSS